VLFGRHLRDLHTAKQIMGALSYERLRVAARRVGVSRSGSKIRIAQRLVEMKARLSGKLVARPWLLSISGQHANHR